MIFKKKSEEESIPVKAQGSGSVKAGEVVASSKAPSANSNADRSLSVMQSSRANDDAIANDLIRRVGFAIDDWAHSNGLTALPKQIIFEQALSILNAIDRNIPSRE